MTLTGEQQDLVDIFTDRTLPDGPQYTNEYSVFLDLAEVVRVQLHHLQGDVVSTRQSAMRLLGEVKAWLEKQPVVATPEVVEAN